MEVIKIAVVGLVGVLLAIQFRNQKPEYSIYIGFVTALIIFFYGVQCLSAVIEQFDLVKAYLGTEKGYLAILLKVVGITYICEFAASVCKDSGYSSIAGQMEIFGKMTVLFSGMPILFAIIESIQTFME